MKSITWILKETVLAIHEAQIIEHGGKFGHGEMSALEDALARPRNLYADWYAKSQKKTILIPRLTARYAFGYAKSQNTILIPRLAASYAFGICAKKPFFVDGNGRVALVTVYAFLHLNGFEVVASDSATFSIFLDVAENRITEKEFEIFLINNTRVMV